MQWMTRLITLASKYPQNTWARIGVVCGGNELVDAGAEETHSSMKWWTSWNLQSLLVVGNTLSCCCCCCYRWHSASLRASEFPSCCQDWQSDVVGSRVRMAESWLVILATSNASEGHQPHLPCPSLKNEKLNHLFISGPEPMLVKLGEVSWRNKGQPVAQAFSQKWTGGILTSILMSSFPAPTFVGPPTQSPSPWILHLRNEMINENDPFQSPLPRERPSFLRQGWEFKNSLPS